MKKTLIFAAILLSSTSLVRADEISDLKAQTEALLKANQALAAKLNAIEKRQKKVEADVAAKPQKYAAQNVAARPDGTLVGDAQWTAADLTRRLLSPTDDSSLTFHGITIYGGIDIGVGYQNHGVPINGYYSPGVEYVISKNSLAKSNFGIAPDALSQSNFGIKGEEVLVPGVAAVFNAQYNFNPQSGLTTDNIKSLTQQNGLAAQSPNQISGGDSSRAVPFNQLYAGLSSPIYGTLTYGRQNALELDQVVAYDPMGGANAFSIIGYQGGFCGGGDTETCRLDDAVKYRVNVGPVRFGALVKLDTANAEASTAYQGNIGFDFRGFSFDATASKINDAISASALSASQLGLVAPATAASAASAAGAAGAVAAGNTSGLVSATASDNTSFMFTGKYTWNQFKLYAGYENTQFANPSNLRYGGSGTIGGYTLLDVNNFAYNVHKDVQIMWAGVKYLIRPDIDLTLAYYHEIQSSFGGSGNAAGAGFGPTANASSLGTLGCSTVAASNCHGTLDAISALVDYRITKRFDVYAGAMWSVVHNGLANGYAMTNAGAAPGIGVAGVTGTNSSAGMIDPTIGARFQF